MSAEPKGSIVCDDARHLGRHVDPESVALTVTSPPYRNAIDYKQHVSNMGSADKKWMRGTGGTKTAEYLDEMADVFGQVLEATRPGGFCGIVIGDEVVNGKLIPLPSLIASRITNTENDDDPSKWRLRDTIVWHKVTSGRNGAGNRCGMFIKYPRAGYFRANIMHEYILILQKGDARPRPSAGGSGRGRGERIPLNRIVKREIANSVWHIPPVPPNLVNHPVPFPEQIPWRLITLLTKRGDLVLDPMNGSGQTTKVARSLGRRYVGLDTEAEYVALARSRLRGKPVLSDYLVPAFYKESWCDGDQRGFFETERVDLSPNVPKDYKLEFRTESDKAIRGNKGVYTYYGSPSGSYLCFIIAESGRQTRLNLGGLRDRESMLRHTLANLPDGPFIKADLDDRLEGRLVENRQPVKACLDVLVRADLVRELDGDGGKRRYELTGKGRRRRRGWSQKRRPAGAAN